MQPKRDKEGNRSSGNENKTGWKDRREQNGERLVAQEVIDVIKNESNEDHITTRKDVQDYINREAKTRKQRKALKRKVRRHIIAKAKTDIKWLVDTTNVHDKILADLRNPNKNVDKDGDKCQSGQTAACWATQGYKKYDLKTNESGNVITGTINENKMLGERIGVGDLTDDYMNVNLKTKTGLKGVSSKTNTYTAIGSKYIRAIPHRKNPTHPQNADVIKVKRTEESPDRRSGGHTIFGQYIDDDGETKHYIDMHGRNKHKTGPGNTIQTIKVHGTKLGNYKHKYWAGLAHAMTSYIHAQKCGYHYDEDPLLSTTRVKPNNPDSTTNMDKMNSYSKRLMAKGIYPGKWNGEEKKIEPTDTTAEWNLRMARKNKTCYLDSNNDAPNVKEKLCNVIKKYTGEDNMKEQHACKKIFPEEEQEKSKDSTDKEEEDDGFGDYDLTEMFN